MFERTRINRRRFVKGASLGLASTGLTFLGGVSCRPTGPQPRVETMSIEEKIGQLMCGRLNAKDVEEVVAEGRVGSLYGLLGNQESARAAAEYLNHLQTISKCPLLIVGEQEHGSARNFAGGTEFPAYMALGATRSQELAYLFGKINTLEGQAVGYNWISCPTLDVNIEGGNPIINTRSLGERPDLVAELGVESCRAIVEHRGLTCVCHFPGHGATAFDSHVELPTVERSRAELQEVELAPFRAGIQGGHLNCIMTAHIHFSAFDPEPGLPATLSHNIITKLLREELGYEGLVATDGLGMKAISANFAPDQAVIRALAAGCDILLCPPDLKKAAAAIEMALEDGTLSMKQLEASVQRILDSKNWLGLFEKATVEPARVDEVVGCSEHRAVAKRVARESVTLLRNEGFPLVKDKATLVVSNASWNDLGPRHANADELLMGEVRKRNPEAQQVVLHTDEVETSRQAVLSARDAEIIILAVSTKIRSYDEEAVESNRCLLALINEIVGLGKHTSIVVFGNPYPVKSFPEPQVMLCTYSNCPDSVSAAVEVLYGERTAVGRLPVTISEQYPYGFGLSETG